MYMYTTETKDIGNMQHSKEYINPYAAGGLFGQYLMMQNTWKITETLAKG